MTAAGRVVTAKSEPHGTEDILGAIFGPNKYRPECDYCRKDFGPYSERSTAMRVLSRHLPLIHGLLGEWGDR